MIGRHEARADVLAVEVRPINDYRAVLVVHLSRDGGDTWQLGYPHSRQVGPSTLGVPAFPILASDARVDAWLARMALQAASQRARDERSER